MRHYATDMRYLRREAVPMLTCSQAFAEPHQAEPAGFDAICALDASSAD